jgi:hypothetical protein
LSGDHHRHERLTSRDIILGFFTNWREYEGSWGSKITLTLKNRTKAFVTLKGCCGNYGEPGC